MLQLPPKTLIRKIYVPDVSELLIVFTAIFWTLMAVPLAFGLWFHSWWVWFAVLLLSITFMLIFFFIVNSYALATGSIAVFSLLWGATGYFIGAFIQSHIGCAPPPLIFGVFVYLITLCIFILPLFQYYRGYLRRTQEDVP